MQRAMETMYGQLVRAFEFARGPGSLWKATNGIHQGCPLSIVLINALIVVWKTKMDSLSEDVVVTTGGLPPLRVRDENHWDDTILVPHGRGRADIAAGGYADDTEVVAPDPDALQRLAPATERWLRLTGQEVNVGKSTTWTLAGDQAKPMWLLGAPIPV